MKTSNANKPHTNRAVGVYVFSDDDSRVLLAQRGPAARHEQFKWEGIGGELEPGESYEQAAEREFVEEVGIAVQLGEVIATLKDIVDSQGTLWQTRIFRGSIDEAPGLPDPSKVAGFAWFTQPEVAAMQHADMLTSYSLKDYKAFDWL